MDFFNNIFYWCSAMNHKDKELKNHTSANCNRAKQGMKGREFGVAFKWGVGKGGCSVDLKYWWWKKKEGC